MPEKRYLDEVELTGVRHVARELLHLGAALSVVLATVGAFLPAVREVMPSGEHRDAIGQLATYAQGPELPYESYYATGGAWLIVVIWLVVVQWLRTRRRGYGGGYKLGIVAALLPIVGLIPLVGLLMKKLDHVGGHHVFWAGWVGIVGCGVLAMVAEPILFIAERRHLERDVDPEFPTARVV